MACTVLYSTCIIPHTTYAPAMAFIKEKATTNRGSMSEMMPLAGYG